MRLLNVNTMKMEEFFDETAPPYVILSHRWGPEEASLQEWNRVLELEDKIHSITRQSAFHTARHANDYHHEIQREKYRKLAEKKVAIRQKAGFSKILSCAELVRKQKNTIEGVDRLYSYVWIDTCCIDKTNNAELSEAINSMFRWYQNSSLCLVHLADIPGDLELNEMKDKVRESKWFERGWTLQELLAPEVVKFFDQSWEFLFDKGSEAGFLAGITRIDKKILTKSSNLSYACTAKKMSWAASRITTRKEDLAYCLLGIFDVNMPLLYGEGDKAFLRLQEEIIRQSGDPSILAWGYHSPEVYGTHRILAHSPADFVGCSEFTVHNDEQVVMSMTNVTLSVRLSYYRPGTEELSFIYADLHCCNSVTAENRIFLPLVIKQDQLGSDANDISSVWFMRPAGARPLLIRGNSLWSAYPGKNWIHQTCTISIEKKDFGVRFPRSSEISLDGLNLPSSQVVVDEVYPPHFWGQIATVLDIDLSRIDQGIVWYPGAVKAKSKVGFHEYDPVAYVRVSLRSNHTSQMVVIVRHLDYDNVEVRLSEWPDSRCASLADYELRSDQSGEDTGGIAKFKPGVEGQLFGDFCVYSGENSITISRSGSTGK